jgi:hypothetical protein
MEDNMTRKLPFDCLVGDEPEEVTNPFSGESITIPADAVAVYDVTIGYNHIAEKSGNPKHWDIVRKGLDWFRKHEPKAYMVLLD